MIFGVFISVFVFACFYIIRQYRSLQYRFPPGPWNVPSIGNLHWLAPFPWIYFREFGRKYGPIAHIQLAKEEGLSVFCSVIGVCINPVASVPLTSMSSNEFFGPMLAAICSLKGDIKNELGNLKESVKEISARVLKVEESQADTVTAFREMDLKLSKATRRLEFLESETRKRSVVIGGLNCGNLPCSEAVRNLFMDSLKLQLPIEAAFVLKSRNNPDPYKIPMIKVILPDKNMKTLLYTKTKLLKDTGCYIRDDLSETELLTRRRLVAEMRSPAHANKRVKLRGNALYINDVKHILKNDTLIPALKRATSKSCETPTPACFMFSSESME
ncbi:unnamed protein product [Allacma fusca]|uniref:Cytochrome P450 n=1 Tax=Allacma fusca TaxID=39272 RepID=A0A8J2JHD5_9HEXA|nr:unnamed protein product [Allacma fusca]